MRMEKSKVKEEIDQVEGDIKSIRGNIEGLLAAAADEDKVLLSGKGEFERSKAEASRNARHGVSAKGKRAVKYSVQKAEGLSKEKRQYYHFS